MALKLPSINSIFMESPEDGDVRVSRGQSWIPEAPSTKKPDEYVVDAAGRGDYLTIADALTALGASSGTIRVLAGNYTITSNISLGANQSIIGSGYGTNITTTSDITLITLSGNRSGIYMCRIDGNNTGGSQIGISASGDECTIKDCWVTQMGFHGISVTGDKCIIEGCRIEDCSDRCIDTNGINYLAISDCYINNAGEEGIQLTGAHDTKIVGNEISSAGDSGIDMVSSTHSVICGNRIFSNGDDNTNGDGIELTTGCNENVITGNHIGNNDGYGVDIQAGAIRNCVVGNVVYNNEDGAILDNGTSTLSVTATDGDDLNVVA